MKNTLATVQALVNTTVRSSPSMEVFRTTFAGRLTSLARTHTLLFDGHGTGTTMRDVLYAELKPYDQDDPKRVTFDGPDVPLTGDLAVGLGMAIHELTTNAAKYGALSMPEGRITVTWSLSATGDLTWSWIESDGPPVSPPTRSGFGSRLLHRVLVDQLRATVERHLEADGVQVRIIIPQAVLNAANTGVGSTPSPLASVRSDTRDQNRQSIAVVISCLPATSDRRSTDQLNPSGEVPRQLRSAYLRSVARTSCMTMP